MLERPSKIPGKLKKSQVWPLKKFLKMFLFGVGGPLDFAMQVGSASGSKI